MSQSPEEKNGSSQSYKDGWASVYRMMREGKSWSGRERNCCFLNTGEPRFSNVSAVSGLDLVDDGRGLAVTDWDRDGAVDFLTTNRTAPRLRLLRGRGSEGHGFVSLRLQGTTCNRDAIGARVELFAGDGAAAPTVRVLRAGDGYVAQSSKWMHFGLGKADAIDRVEVLWPDGKRETFRGLTPGRRFSLVQGAGAASGVDALPRVSLSASTPEPPQSPATRRVPLAGRMPVVGWTYEGAGGRVPIRADGRPMLINLWASWCAACRRELADFAREADRFEENRVRVIALSVDEPSKRGDAKEMLDELDWPFEQGFAPDELLDVIRVLREVVLDRPGELALPTSLLIDPQQRVAVIYEGPVDVETLFADARRPVGSERAQLDFASPFRGRWVSPPLQASFLPFAMQLLSAGHLDVAAQYLRGVQMRSDIQVPPHIREQMSNALHQLGRELNKAGRGKEASEVLQRAAAFRR